MDRGGQHEDQIVWNQERGEEICQSSMLKPRISKKIATELLCYGIIIIITDNFFGAREAKSIQNRSELNSLAIELPCRCLPLLETYLNTIIGAII